MQTLLPIPKVAVKFRNVTIVGKVAVEQVDATNWKLLRSYTVLWTNGGLTASVGFITDFASIPRIVRSIIPQMGNQNGPSIIHDLCYRMGGKYLSRAEADMLYLLAMKVAGVGWWKRNTIYLGVRSGGWVSWNRYGEGQANGR